MSIYISFDDIDSPRGGCTTHFTTQIFYEVVRKLAPRTNNFTLPRLIRLNPDIPWKTRGNAATCIEAPLTFDEGLELIEDLVLNRLSSYIEGEESVVGHTQPCITVIDKEEVERNKSRLLRFYLKAVKRVVSIQETEEILKHMEKMKTYTFNGKRGLVGALAAIGGVSYQGYKPTYELLAYTDPAYKKTVDEDELYRVLENLERDDTFGHIDRRSGRVLVLPRGRDPVLVGLRGINPVELIRILDNIKKYLPPIYMWIIFKTNQATNMHFYNVGEPDIPRRYEQFSGPALIRFRKEALEGGHLIISTKLHIGGYEYDSDLAIYSEAGYTTKKVSTHLGNTWVYITGNIRPLMDRETINHEAIYIYEDPIVSTRQNPLCPKCMRRMESAGESKGYKCRLCEYRLTIDVDPSTHRVVKWIPDRTIQPASHQRHLTRPLKLFGSQKTLEELEKTAIELVISRNLILHRNRI